MYIYTRISRFARESNGTRYRSECVENTIDSLGRPVDLFSTLYSCENRRRRRQDPLSLLSSLRLRSPPYHSLKKLLSSPLPDFFGFSISEFSSRLQKFLKINAMIYVNIFIAGMMSIRTSRIFAMGIKKRRNNFMLSFFFFFFQFVFLPIARHLSRDYMNSVERAYVERLVEIT